VENIALPRNFLPRFPRYTDERSLCGLIEDPCCSWGQSAQGRSSGSGSPEFADACGRIPAGCKSQTTEKLKELKNRMKIIAIQRKRTVLATAGFLALVLTVAGLSVAWTSQHHYRLGGSWIGVSSTLTWNCVQTPLEPDGQTAALRVAGVSWTAEFMALLGAFGADTPVECVGEARMISRDTARYTIIGYPQLAANPGQIAAIFVYSGTFKFTGHDTGVLNYTLNVYPPSADGLPNLSAAPLYTVPGITDTAKRVPVL
jgi:hypothetical protein